LSKDIDSQESVYAALRNMLTDALRKAVLAPGQRFFSIRKLSDSTGANQSAVRKAFEQLIAEGWLEVRPGSGTFIAHTSMLLVRQMEGTAEIDTIEVLTAPDFATTYGAANFRRDTDDIVVCAGTRFEKAIDAWVQDCQSKPLGVTQPAGFLELREMIAGWLNQTRGMNCSPDNIVIMNNLAECRNFVARLFLEAGKAVLVEDPGVNGAWLGRSGAQLKPVSVDDSGMVPEEFESVTASLAYVTPSCQIPTGAVLSKPRRQKLLDWTYRNQAILVEEDTNCAFTYDSRITPAIHALDEHQRTLYIGSMEDILPAEMQIAFVVVPPSLREPFTRLKSLSTRCTSPIVQRLVWRLFESEFVQERIRKLQRILEINRVHLLDQLANSKNSKIFYSPGKSGTTQTIWLPPEIDDLTLASDGGSSGVTAISPCYITLAGRPGLVLSFGRSSGTISTYVTNLLNILQKKEVGQ